MNEQRFIDLNNERYQYVVGNAVDVLNQNDFRIIQLPTISRLTTNNSSIVEDFPVSEVLRFGTGVNPYDKYIIRVCDTYATELNIIVHQHDDYALLCPIVLGFKSGNACSFIKLTDNWRIRDLQLFHGLNNTLKKVDNIPLKNINFVNLESEYLDRAYVYMTESSEFSKDGSSIPVLKVCTAGFFDRSFALKLDLPKVNLFERWIKSSDYKKHEKMAANSSSALVLQIFLHTLLLWKKRCNERKIVIRKIMNKSDNNESVLNDKLSNYQSSNKCIIDINKDIIIYENSGASSKQFKGYHMTMTMRCGHFRHYKTGQTIYIPPTTVHFKKILPDAFNGINKTIIYRNTEDFLREKSYLENDICTRLRQLSIKFEREKMFDWMGRKRLDFYLPDYNIAIECQGVQHFYRYGSSDLDFDKRIQRDTDKFNECKANGIKILYYMNDSIILPEFIQNKDLYYTDIDLLLSFI